MAQTLKPNYNSFIEIIIWSTDATYVINLGRPVEKVQQVNRKAINKSFKRASNFNQSLF